MVPVCLLAVSFYSCFTLSWATKSAHIDAANHPLSFRPEPERRRRQSAGNLLSAHRRLFAPAPRHHDAVVKEFSPDIRRWMIRKRNGGRAPAAKPNPCAFPAQRVKRCICEMAGALYNCLRTSQHRSQDRCPAPGKAILVPASSIP